MAKIDKAETKSLTKGEAATSKLQGEGQPEKAEAKKESTTNPMATAKLEVSILVRVNGEKPVVYNVPEVSPSKNYRKFAIRADEDLDIYGQVCVWTGTEE